MVRLSVCDFFMSTGASDRYYKSDVRYRAQMCVMLHRFPGIEHTGTVPWRSMHRVFLLTRRTSGIEFPAFDETSHHDTSNIAPRLFREVRANPARSQSR